MTEYSIDGVNLKYRKPGSDYDLCLIRKKNLKKQQQQQLHCKIKMIWTTMLLFTGQQLTIHEYWRI